MISAKTLSPQFRLVSPREQSEFQLFKKGVEKKLCKASKSRAQLLTNFTNVYFLPRLVVKAQTSVPSYWQQYFFLMPLLD